MKNCKCGRRIPLPWPRCGECDALRMKVVTDHQIEQESYRAKVAKRHSLAVALAELRPKPEPVKETKTKKASGHKIRKDVPIERMSVDTERELELVRLLQRTRINNARRSIHRAAHKRVAEGLKEWMAEDD